MARKKKHQKQKPKAPAAEAVQAKPVQAEPVPTEAVQAEATAAQAAHQAKEAEATQARLKRVAEKRARHLELETKQEEVRALKRKRKAENIALQEENLKRKKEKKEAKVVEVLERETTGRLEKAECTATVILDSPAILAHIQQLAGPEARLFNRPLPTSLSVRFPTAKAAQAFLKKSTDTAPVVKLTTRPHPHPARMLRFPRAEGLGKSKSEALPLLRTALEAISLPFAFIEGYKTQLAVQFHTDAAALKALTRFQKNGFLVNNVNVAPTMTMGIP